MSDKSSKAPHFLRVVRALARVRGAAVPIATVATAIVGSFNCAYGVPAMSGTGGAGGATTHTGTAGSSSLASGGFTGMGVTVMVDAGPDGSSSSTSSGAGGGDGGH